MYACMYVCIYMYALVCMYACMYVCIYMYVLVCMYACMYVCAGCGAGDGWWLGESG
jgi:hypothetical protein